MSLGKILGHPQDVRSYETWDGFILPTCRLGLEFEFESVAHPVIPESLSWSAMWERHNERSIRDNGMEYVFRVPMFGRDAHRAIISLMSHAVESGWKCSKRTGIHVHVDARDLEIRQLQGISLLYALYEPAVYRWVGDNRDSNVFCLPWYRAEGGITDAAAVLRAGLIEERRPGQMREAAGRVNRYAGMNLKALHEHGSIEFRQLKTTLDQARVLNWINIVLAFKQGALLAPTCDGALLGMIEARGPRAVGRELFGSTFDLIDYPELEEDVLTIGMPTANQLVQEGIEPDHSFTTIFPGGSHAGFRRFMENSRPLEGAPEAMFPPSPVQMVPGEGQLFNAARQLEALRLRTPRPLDSPTFVVDDVVQQTQAGTNRWMDSSILFRDLSTSFTVQPEADEEEEERDF